MAKRCSNCFMMRDPVHSVMLNSLQMACTCEVQLWLWGRASLPGASPLLTASGGHTCPRLQQR